MLSQEVSVFARTIGVVGLFDVEPSVAPFMEHDTSLSEPILPLFLSSGNP